MIPVAEPLLKSEDIERAKDCLQSGWISSAGKYIEEFESSWARYCNMPFGVAVSNGSVALDIAVRLLDLKPGDEVIMPSFTIICCANAIIANNGVPVLVDQEPNNWQMDISQIEAKITIRTRAIMVVHIYGHPVDMDPVIDLCKRYNLMLIEDAAEVHGALYKGKPCGGFADISTFSFYANKLITCGEGGMLLIKDEILAERAKSYRNLCFQAKRRFVHEELGQNFRLTNLQAALAVGQVLRIEEIVERKRLIASRYTELLGSQSGITLPKEAQWARNVYWIYGIITDKELGDDCLWLMNDLKEKEIETRPFFWPMHEQPVLKKLGLFSGENYPISESLARRGFYIPSGLTIEDEQMKKVVDVISTSVNKRLSRK